MTDYIDRGQLLADIENTIRITAKDTDSSELRGARRVIARIKAMPTAEMCPHYIRNIHDRGDDSLCKKAGCEVKDVQPIVHGHWIYAVDSDIQLGSYRCSACGNCSPHVTNYCGLCGADMRR